MGSILSETDRCELAEISKLLHLVFHRNKNQHRLTKWWKWLSMLRRSINTTQIEPDVQRVDAQVNFIRDILIHKCHRAFSNVVADSQFSSLGLVLVAILARVNRIVGGRQDLPGDDGEDDPGFGMDLDQQNAEDLGEAVARDLDAVVDDGTRIIKSYGDGSDEEVAPAPKRSATPVPSKHPQSTKSAAKPKKKKRGSANAIDDLFSGLS